MYRVLVKRQPGIEKFAYRLTVNGIVRRGGGGMKDERIEAGGGGGGVGGGGGCLHFFAADGGDGVWRSPADAGGESGGETDGIPAEPNRGSERETGERKQPGGGGLPFF